MKEHPMKSSCDTGPPGSVPSHRRHQTPPHRKIGPAGMTLLEVTVVILVLLSLVATLFFGAQSWKRGSDRAICIVNIHNVQKGVRSYSNLYGFDPGASVPGLKTQVIGLGRFVEVTPTCPGSGVYNFGGGSGEDVIPQMGSLYMDCNLATSDAHVPNITPDW
jgi:hypothetical protein